MRRIRLFALKTHAETGLSEDEYRRARKLYFRLKYQLLLSHFLIGAVGAAALCMMIIPAALLMKGWDATWSTLPWGRLIVFGCVICLLAGLSFALGNFFFATPLPPDRNREDGG
ncbi:MAG: hypothetical protein EPO55_00245 [Reyranella sp.]|uniref:hypothetical protein n=1 Tax=Reyranella sp. TaxID=1929291 RepID=UPI0011FB251B|nr:hypothetical protein [Reyranella sp.]TAJ42936.1 MAG: hypothetical protein EPO55_00245 [Reyranella sp.]